MSRQVFNNILGALTPTGSSNQSDSSRHKLENGSKQFNLPEDKQEFYCYSSQYQIQSFYTAQAQMKNIFELLDSLQYNEILLDEYINCLGIAFETDQAKIRNYMKQIKFLENTGKGF